MICLVVVRVDQIIHISIAFEKWSSEWILQQKSYVIANLWKDSDTRMSSI